MNITSYEFDIPNGMVKAELAPQPWSNESFKYHITFKNRQGTFYSWLAHKGIIALLKEQGNFNTFLDIGSGDGQITKIFKFLEKETTAVEPYSFSAKSQDFPVTMPDYQEDYLNINFDKQFDVIWCSHVFEHIRNPGLFLDKIFDDLKEDGMLVLTVPYNETGNIEHIVDGHNIKLGIGLIIYHLINAGFDCKEISIEFFTYEMTVVLKKKSIGLKKIGTANTFTNIHSFFPDAGQKIIYDNKRIAAYEFTKNPINWKW